MSHLCQDCTGEWRCSLLESLPIDIWHTILGCLVEERPSAWVTKLGFFPRQPLYRHFWHIESIQEDFSGFVESRMAQQQLLNLSLTSKAIAAVAEPYLYKCIVLHNGRGLASLDDLFRRRPGLGQHIHKLICAFDLQSRAAIEDWYARSHEDIHGIGMGGVVKRQDLSAVLQHSSKSKTSKRRKKPPRPISTVSWSGRRDLPESLVPIFNRILQQTLVKDISCSWYSIVSALCGPPPKGNRKSRVYHRHDYWLLMPGTFWRFSANLPLRPEHHALSALKHLRLRRDADPTEVLWWLPWLPSLETLELTGILRYRGLWWLKSSIDEYDETFPLVTQLKLREMHLFETEVVQLLDLFPSLHTIMLGCVTCDEGRASFSRKGPAQHQKTFQEALHERRKMLRHVDLRCDKLDNFTARPITNLHKFKRLEHLSITIGNDPNDTSKSVQRWSMKPRTRKSLEN